jgi:DNA-binding NarL/FixJ family response regulator
VRVNSGRRLRVSPGGGTPPIPSYVFLDLLLPDGDGATFLPLLRPLRPRPLVAVVSIALDAARVLALHGDCLLMLPKPVGEQQSLQLIRLLRAAAAPSVAVQIFAQRESLSRQESALLHLAVRGLNNDEAADVLRCRRATVSTYWNRIFAKTGFRCQRDVIAGLLRFRADGRTPALFEGTGAGHEPQVLQSGQYARVVVDESAKLVSTVPPRKISR